MVNFATTIGRRLRSFSSKSRWRPNRPAKVEAIRRYIEDAQAETATPSLYTVDTTTEVLSPVERGNDVDNSASIAASPTKPEPVSEALKIDNNMPEESTEAPVPTLRARDHGLVQGEQQSFLRSEQAGSNDMDFGSVYEPCESLLQPDETEDNLAQDTEADAEAVDEQAIREDAYVAIVDEGPDDYTDGPPRIVVATDNVKPCAALLLTFDLSANLRRALRAERGFAKAEQKTLRQVQVNMKYEDEIHSQIASRKTRIAQLEEEDQATVESQITALYEELEVLQDMAKSAKNRRQAIHSGLETRATNLRRIQALANADLEEALIYAKLLEPGVEEPASPVEEIDIQEEYKAFCRDRQLAELGDFEGVEPLHTGKEHLRAAPLSPGQQAIVDLKRGFWNADERLQEARMAFERRDYDRALDLQARDEAILLGQQPTDASSEAFDLRWLRHYQQLTGEVIEAEEVRDQAKAALLAAGLTVDGEDEASGFVDDAEDGYALSMEQAMIKSVPQPKISSWLNDISDQKSPVSDNFVEVDNWETRPLDVGDSMSVIADGSDRKRIDRWKEMCGL